MDDDSEQSSNPTNWPDVAIYGLGVIAFLGSIYLVLYFFSHFS